MLSWFREIKDVIGAIQNNMQLLLKSWVIEQGKLKLLDKV